MHVNHGDKIGALPKERNSRKLHQPGHLLENKFISHEPECRHPSVHLHQSVTLNHTNTYLKEEVKEVFSEAVLKAACYNVANQLGLFLSNWEMERRNENELPLLFANVKSAKLV